MNKSKSQVGFSLIKVTTEEFTKYDSVYNDDKDVQFGTNISFGLNDENHMIVVLLTVKFSQNEIPFLILKAACHFDVEESSWNKFLNTAKKDIIFPRGFIGHLVMLTIGTTRGILHSETKGTAYNKFLLPTINVNEIIKDDLVMKVKKE